MSTKMRPIKGTISLSDARAHIARALQPIDRTERIPIARAGRRALASDVISPVDVPPFDRAAMDGYAVRAEDTFGATAGAPKDLRCLEQVFTGQMPTRAIGPGECSEVATGAPMPDGADAVVMVEETDKDEDGSVHVFTPAHPRLHVGARGADIRRDQAVLRAGDVLNPARIGVLAALGMTEVEVYARPRVALLSTGNEIVEPGEPLGPGQIYDINRFSLAAIIAEYGGEPVPHRTAADTIEDLGRAVEACLDEDVLVFSGGSSVGERDLVLDVLTTRGTLIFHGIAVKPGKPTAFGVIRGRPFFGMPGYPTSCLSNAYMLLVPAVRRMGHLPELRLRTTTLPLAQRVVSTTGRHQFYTVRIVAGEAHPAFKGSGDITSMALADGYIEIPAETDIVEKGESVEVTLF